MKLSRVLVGAVIVCGSFGRVYAQDKTPVVDQREKNQQERIDQGIKSGELTKREAMRLEAQQGKIKVDEAKAKSDGVVTAKERAKLKREQNRASRAIYRKKHNARVQKP
jgi:hypothetical protein